MRNLITVILLFVGCLGVADRAWAVDRFASTLGSDAANTCVASATPCRTVGHALSQAGSGDSVKVAGGLYVENVTVSTPTTLAVSGGWSADFGVQDPVATPSVLRAAAELSVVSVIAVGVAIDFTADGLTIERGKNETPSSGAPCMQGRGGGICVHVGSGGVLSVALNRLLVQRNVASGSGGGLAAIATDLGSSLTMTVSESTFAKNRASFGGGIAIRVGQDPTVAATIEGVLVVKNRAGAGGGMSIGEGTLPVGQNAQVLIRNSHFEANRAIEALGFQGQGAGLLSSNTGCDPNGCPLTVENSVFTKNRAEVGGGVRVSGGIELVSSTLTRNTSTRPPAAGGSGGGGGSVVGFAADRGTIRNTVLWGNRGVQPRDLNVRDLSSAIALDHSNVGFQEGPITDLGGNISINPEFVSGRDLHLRPGSPAIDAGTCAGAPATDFDGDPRPSGGGCDIGADEFAP